MRHLQTGLVPVGSASLLRPADLRSETGWMAKSAIQPSVRSGPLHTLTRRQPWLNRSAKTPLRLGARNWPRAVAVGSPGPGLACNSRADEAR